VGGIEKREHQEEVGDENLPKPRGGRDKVVRCGKP
jgi:hypothetical protein